MAEIEAFGLAGFGGFVNLGELVEDGFEVLPVEHEVVVGNGVWTPSFGVDLLEAVCILFFLVLDDLVVLVDDFDELLPHVFALAERVGFL